ncbi:MAG: beta-propeller fold lactonase family protein [Acidobacteria bacterium]|nr:beta-propeller fold lactonase family protein [Acidobacteriota bacterium]
MCQWLPASASGSLASALQQERQAARAAGESPTATRRAEVVARKPARMIRDPYAAYSSIAVDPVHDEVVLTDENLFQILVYDRLANTPPRARMTEPKRMLGGMHTKIEFQCGLYIDPTNGDIFAVNNDTVRTLVIFSRSQRGNVPPARELYTPRGTFGIAVHETTEEMYLTLQHDNAVSVFHKYAEKDDAPVRLLQGNRTMLADPHGIVLDTKNKEMFISNYGSHHLKQSTSQEDSREEKANWPNGVQLPGSGRHLPASITVYPLNASGDTPPLRVIQGPKTEMNWPTALAIDVERGELYVANDMGDSILVFSVSASGDVAPLRTLKGPKSLVKNPTGVFLDLKNDELWVANFGNHSATVYKRGASGDTPPLRVIRSGPLNEPSLGIGNPHPVAYDTKREEILVPN